MFFPFTVAATLLSLVSDVPLLLQATKNAAVNASSAAALINLTVVCTLDRCSFKDYCEYRVAGYLTIAPALMDRVELGYESEDYGPTGFARVGELMKDFSQATALPDIEAAVKAVAGAGKVGITGYCFGGATSWRAAHAGLGLSAASGYYGGGLLSYIDLAPKVPTEMHYAESDKGIPLEQVEALRQRYPELGIYLYPGDHGFCNFDRAEKYNAASAKLANERTLAFFAKHLA